MEINGSQHVKRRGSKFIEQNSRHLLQFTVEYFDYFTSHSIFYLYASGAAGHDRTNFISPFIPVHCPSSKEK